MRACDTCIFVKSCYLDLSTTPCCVYIYILEQTDYETIPYADILINSPSVFLVTKCDHFNYVDLRLPLKFIALA